jgi:hypothetical protein
MNQDNQLQSKDEASHKRHGFQYWMNEPIEPPIEAPSGWNPHFEPRQSSPKANLAPVSGLENPPQINERAEALVSNYASYKPYPRHQETYHVSFSDDIKLKVRHPTEGPFQPETPLQVHHLEVPQGSIEIPTQLVLIFFFFFILIYRLESRRNIWCATADFLSPPSFPTRFSCWLA